MKTCFIAMLVSQTAKFVHGTLLLSAPVHEKEADERNNACCCDNNHLGLTISFLHTVSACFLTMVKRSKGCGVQPAEATNAYTEGRKQGHTSASAEYMRWGDCSQMSLAILGRQAQITSSNSASSPGTTGPASLRSVRAGTFCCSSSRSSAAHGRGSSRLDPSADGGLRPPCRQLPI